MRNIHSRRLGAHAVLLAIPALAGPALSYGSDTYNPATKQLAIPELQYGNATFWNAIITPGKILGVGGGAPMGYWDAYAYIFPTGFELIAPSVTVGATTGHLVSTRLVNILVLDDGRIAVGAVTTDALVAAAASA